MEFGGTDTIVRDRGYGMRVPLGVPDAGRDLVVGLLTPTAVAFPSLAATVADLPFVREVHIYSPAVDRQTLCHLDVLVVSGLGPATGHAAQLAAEAGIEVITVAELETLLNTSVGGAPDLRRDSVVENIPSIVPEPRRAENVPEPVAPAGIHPPPLPAPLTSRERQVLEFLADGMSNKQIAKRLSISVHGAKRICANIFLKLGCTNRTSAATIALRYGLVAA